jgi:hypothetical protein
MTTPLKDARPPVTDIHDGPTANGGRGLSCAQRSALESLGAQLLRGAEESQPVLETAWDELMARWGVHGQPIGIQRLRERIQEECGSEPGDNALSRELTALREEHRP